MSGLFFSLESQHIHNLRKVSKSTTIGANCASFLMQELLLLAYLLLHSKETLA